MSNTTFQDFQATRHELDNGTLVYSYGNCTLEINLNTDYPNYHGKYALTLERDFWISDNLPQLESRLYRWAQEEL